jgi:hypothetical protein
MPRLLVHVEGETEETFVNELLGPYLVANGYERVSARLIGNARQRERRGGIRAWSAVREDILRHLKEDGGAVATTMVDFYALPATGGKGWPGRATASGKPTAQKGDIVEEGMLEDIVAAMGGSFNAKRFVPHVMVHEYEGLLFSDCDAFGRGIGRSDLSPSFHAIRNQFGTPEDINDSVDTAPSKRVLALVPGYQKPLLGTLAALEIGLDRIRNECPRFASWLARLETSV